MKSFNLKTFGLCHFIALVKHFAFLKGSINKNNNYYYNYYRLGGVSFCCAMLGCFVPFNFQK